jgi:hypothetical protein
MQVVPMEVVTVDKSSATITAKEDDSGVFENIRLKSAIDEKNIGIILFPKVGSSVLVGRIANEECNLFVVKINEIESALIAIEGAFGCELDSKGRLVFNQGKNEGLVVLGQLEYNIDALKQYISAVADAVKPIATAVDGIVPGTSAAYTASITAAKLKCEFKQMENENIKH